MLRVVVCACVCAYTHTHTGMCVNRCIFLYLVLFTELLEMLNEIVDIQVLAATAEQVPYTQRERERERETERERQTDRHK